MPSSRHARMTRTAISPRLAMRSLRNTSTSLPCLPGLPSPTAGSNSPAHDWLEGREGVTESVQTRQTRKARQARETILGSGDIHEHQRLSVFDRGGIFDQNADDAAADLALNLVEQFHRLDDAHRLAGLDHVALADKRRRVGLGRAKERTDHRGGDGDQMVTGHGGGGRGGGGGGGGGRGPGARGGGEDPPCPPPALFFRKT